MTSTMSRTEVVDTQPAVAVERAQAGTTVHERRLEVAGPSTEATILPSRPKFSGPQQRRVLGRWSRREAMLQIGVLASSVSTTLLIHGRLTPASGRLAFVVVFFLVFLATYAAVAALTEKRPAVVDMVMSALMTSAAVVAFFALFSVVFYTFYRAFSALKHLNFYTQDLSKAGPAEPLTTGGMTHAIVGTLVITALSLILTVPLSMACAVFLNESRSRGAVFVRTVVTAMTALPSVVAGLFIFATFILILGFERSGLAASVAISIMMLPIIIRSADVVLRLVPGNLREASAALGAPQWRTVWHVVLPTARSGLMTSVILGVARGVGETAPVLLTAGYTGTMNTNPLHNPMASLPLAAYELVRSPMPNQVARGFGSAALLMIVVLVLFTLARVLGGRPAGRLSKRQAARTAARSAADLQRFDARNQTAFTQPAATQPARHHEVRR
jgi:phosphate transport system permease protein